MSSKILVVDDEVNIVKLVSARLTKEGYQVITAENGEEALEKVKAESPDLIILDVMMPPPNGLQVCHQLKEDPSLSKIPIIMLTAKGTESDQYWGQEAGANAYITKPYSSEELLDKVNRLLIAS